MSRIFRLFLDKFAMVFTKDTLIYSKTQEKHAKHLRTMLDILKEKQLYAKLSKCKFWIKGVQFLRHVISTQGIPVNPTKVEAMFHWKFPKNAYEIRSFVGLAGYYWRFIEEFLKMVAPLT